MKFLSFTSFIFLLLIHFSLTPVNGRSIRMNKGMIKDTLPSQQLLVVVADNWDTLQGTLYGYNKINGEWVLQFTNPVVLGEKGLGLGKSLVPVTIELCRLQLKMSL